VRLVLDPDALAARIVEDVAGDEDVVGGVQPEQVVRVRELEVADDVPVVVDLEPARRRRAGDDGRLARGGLDGDRGARGAVHLGEDRRGGLVGASLKVDRHTGPDHVERLLDRPQRGGLGPGRGVRAGGRDVELAGGQGRRDAGLGPLLGGGRLGRRRLLGGLLCSLLYGRIERDVASIVGVRRILVRAVRLLVGIFVLAGIVVRVLVGIFVRLLRRHHRGHLRRDLRWDLGRLLGGALDGQLGVGLVVAGGRDDRVVSRLGGRDDDVDLELAVVVGLERGKNRAGGGPDDLPALVLREALALDLDLLAGDRLVGVELDLGIAVVGGHREALADHGQYEGRQDGERDEEPQNISGVVHRVHAFPRTVRGTQ
jgi:hypothetical protein